MTARLSWTATLFFLLGTPWATEAQNLRVFLTTLSEEQLNAVRGYVEEMAHGVVLYEGGKDPRQDMLLSIPSESFGSLAELYFRYGISFLESHGCATGPVRAIVEPSPMPASLEQSIREEGGVRDSQDPNVWLIPVEALPRIEALEDVDFLHIAAGYTSQFPTDPAILVGSCHEYAINTYWRSVDATSFTRASGRQVARDSALFWFFEPSNIELQVKVLEACAVNGHRWVFIAGLTDLEVRIEVSAYTEPGNPARLYTSVGGGAFEPVLDTTAFPCA
jgi:hypothetical protein